MRYKRRSYLTLIETLIALSLISILLMIVFGFFRDISIINSETEKIQKENFQLRYMDSRLNKILQHINETGDKQYSQNFFFYLEPTLKEISNFPSLIFSFDNQARLDPDFSSYVLARLFVDHQNQLCLMTWPLINEKEEEIYEKMKKEILLTHVEDLAFRFYSPPEQKLDPKDFNPDTIDPENTSPKKNKWYEQEWFLSFNQLPAIFQLHITRDSGDSVVFSYVLPSKLPVYYPAGVQ